MLCYRFSDQSAFLAAAAAEGFTYLDEDDNVQLQAYSSSHAIDVGIPIITTPGTYDEEGIELTPPVYDSGYHVNLIGTHPASWDAYVVTPETPSRIFAGQPGPAAF